MGSRTRAGGATLAGLSAGLPIGISAVLSTCYFAVGALPPVPQPAENPTTEAKRVLGKMLFWDEQLSTSNVVSCGTCHLPSQGGTDNRLARNPGVDLVLNTPDDVLGSPGVILSDPGNSYERDLIFGIGPQITGRSANSNINAAYAPSLFWDGRATSRFLDPETGAVAIASGGALESQAAAPPVSSVEMAHRDLNWAELTTKLRRVRPLDLATNIPADVSAALASDQDYPRLFELAFGDDAITAKRIAFALAAYQRTLISDQTPFDRFRAGQANALTPQQVQGFNEFQAHRCAACHSVGNDLFTDFSFRNVGLRPPAEDLGRQLVTGNTGDRGRFKVPSLRNVGLKRTFMHNGQIQSLADVLRFYARAPGAAPQFPDNRDPLMNAVVPLPPQDAGLIQDFLQNALTDPRVASQTFPFDRPTLFTERAGNQSVIIGGGVPGIGGTIPRIIVQAPSLLGNMHYRIGLDGANPSSNARLLIAGAGPTNGVIDGTSGFETLTTSGAGLATQHWPLVYGAGEPGQTIFAQWVVADPSAAGGFARSSVARITFFCGSAGCPSACDAIDLFKDGAVDINDLLAFLEDFEAGHVDSDLDNGQGLGVPDGGVDINDLLFFFARFEAGC